MGGPVKTVGKGIGNFFKTPAPKRLDAELTAPTPELRGPSSAFLQGFLQNPQGVLQGLVPQQSDLQRQTAGTWSNFLAQPNASTRAFETALPSILKQLTGDPGADVLGAAQPIFQRNLQLGADTLRQSGPRFASNTERLVGEQGRQAVQDFNLFSQNVIENALGRQLTAAGTLGQLGGAADQATLAGLTGAGGFANQQQADIMQFLGPLFQQMFGTAFAGGGITQQPTVTQGQSGFEKALGYGGQIANIIGAVKGGQTFQNPYGGGPQPVGGPNIAPSVQGISPIDRWTQQGGTFNPAWLNLPQPKRI